MSNRQVLTQSREGDWGVGGAVLGITLAIMQGLVRRWQGRLGGNKGVIIRERWDNRVNRRVSNRRKNNELDMDDEDVIDEKVLENIEEEYYKHQYTKHAEYKLVHNLKDHMYDLDNLNKDFFQR